MACSSASERFCMKTPPERTPAEAPPPPRTHIVT
ncbi:hypothetical protein CCACVL1_19400 [Corchorus capsularis]|uniref:Uncharacterized protein n=1 Tax=Corchorus capsularis TaxID=210143 RepID=A0A1R3HH09_COCAP|nr:hypothetical protein CCACVL1_19400 [Corchorus capsularis]